MNDIANKMRESVEAAAMEEKNPIEPEEQAQDHEEEPSETEVLAKDSGWSPDKTDKDGNTLSAEEFLARKPLFNKIRNQGDQLAEMQQTLKELKADSLKQAQASMKENETLLAQLKEAKETHLDNLDVDEVRKIDKQIESVQEEMATKTTEQQVSPYFADFVKDNEWAKDDDNPLSIAAEGIARRYIAKNGSDINDEKMYQYIHDQVRKDFPEKFETKKVTTNKVASATKRTTGNYNSKKGMTGIARRYIAKNGSDINDEKMYQYIHDQVRKDFPEKFETKKVTTNKVASATKRTTGNYNSKKGMTINDISDEDTRRIVENMARQTGKTTDEYLKNYTPDDFK